MVMLRAITRDAQRLYPDPALGGVDLDARDK
jgi:hypothetical protein